MRERAAQLLIYGANTTLGWRVVRTVTFAEGERRVERGTFRRVNDGITGKHIGYQLISSSEQRGDRDLQSQPSSASISMREMQFNVEHSRTAALPEHRRLERRVPEDHVERVQAKVLVFAVIGDKKGDVLRVWPRDKSLHDLREASQTR